MRKDEETSLCVLQADVTESYFQPALLSDRYEAQILTFSIFTVTAAINIDYCRREQTGKKAAVSSQPKRPLSLPQDRRE